jgi:hypothetical protein
MEYKPASGPPVEHMSSPAENDFTDPAREAYQPVIIGRGASPAEYSQPQTYSETAGVPPREPTRIIETAEAPSVADPAHMLEACIMPDPIVRSAALAAIDATAREQTALYADNAAGRDAVARMAGGMRWLYTGDDDSALAASFIRLQTKNGLSTLRLHPDITQATADCFIAAIDAATQPLYDTVLPAAALYADNAEHEVATAAWLEASPIIQLLQSFETPPTTVASERPLTDDELRGKAATIGKSIDELMLNPTFRRPYDRAMWQLHDETVVDTASQPTPHDNPVYRARRYLAEKLIAKHAQLTQDDVSTFDPMRLTAYRLSSGKFEYRIIPSDRRYPIALVSLTGDLLRDIEGTTESILIGESVCEVIHRLFDQEPPAAIIGNQTMADIRAQLEVNTRESYETLAQPDYVSTLWIEKAASALAHIRRVDLPPSPFGYNYYGLLRSGADDAYGRVTESHNQYVDIQQYRQQSQVEVGAILADNRADDDRSSSPLFTWVDAAEAHWAASDAPVCMQVIFEASADMPVSMLRCPPGYAIVAHHILPDGRHDYTYAYDDAGNPYGGDIGLSEAQRGQVIGHWKDRGYAPLVAAILARPDVSMRAIERIIRTESRYYIPSEQEYPGYYSDRPKLQCTGADEVLSSITSLVLSNATTRPLDGAVADAEGHISALQHRQTLVVYEGRQYVFDATPTTFDTASASPHAASGRGARGLRQVLRRMARPTRQNNTPFVKRTALSPPPVPDRKEREASITEQKRLAAPDAPELNAVQRIESTAQLLSSLREAVDERLRLHFGIEHDAAYVGREGIARLLIKQHPNSQDVLRTAYRHIADAAPLSAGSVAGLSAAELVQRCQAIDRSIEDIALYVALSDEKRHRIGMPDHPKPVLRQLASDITQVRRHYETLIALQ